MKTYREWGWLVGAVVAVALTVLLLRASAPPITRFTTPPSEAATFSRADFDRGRTGLPEGVGGVRLGMSKTEVMEAMRYRSYGAVVTSERPIPGGERWDCGSAYVWRIQFDGKGKVIAVAGPWMRLTWDGDAVRFSEVGRDFEKQPSTEQALSYAFGPPNETLEVGTLGKVVVWDRLPTVQMQVHLKSGMAVISAVPVHRLFADE